jgi:protein-disulfide isomerase
MLRNQSERQTVQLFRSMQKTQILLAVFLLTTLAAAQDKESILKPPKGSDVAIVIFEDLECPDCARAAPLVEEAAKTYKIPVVRHDYPLPKHEWAYDAAILARFFDTHSKALGNQFRDTVFQHQLEITSKPTLHDFAAKFGAANKVDVPFIVDPQGKLAAQVEADRAIGNAIGLDHTPTLYVVSNKRAGTPFVEVVDRTQLFQLIDSMKKE